MDDRRFHIGTNLISEKKGGIRSVRVLRKARKSPGRFPSKAPIVSLLSCAVVNFIAGSKEFAFGVKALKDPVARPEGGKRGYG
jgi:hypothetical protein